jgi:heme oxygenase
VSGSHAIWHRPRTGDLSGGQTIARAVEAAYGLERDSMAFYRFGTLDDADATAGPSEMKRIKAWFRQGMDLAGSHLTERQKGESLRGGSGSTG